MNLQEFKAWFEGFTENMKGAPSEKAWKRIQERVAEITEKPTEVRHFYDHYWRPYSWPYYSYGGTSGLQGGYSGLQNTIPCNSANNAPKMTFTSAGEAFKSLGYADAYALSNSASMQARSSEEKALTCGEKTTV